VGNRIIRWLKFPAINLYIARGIVFLLVILTWVPFRAESLAAMRNIYSGMLGLNGIGDRLKFDGDIVLIAISALAIIVWFMPNTYEWMQKTAPALSTKGYLATEITINEKDEAWKPDLLHAFIISVLFFLSLLKLTDASEFIYFQF
jgi:hypothetical protein